MSAVIEDKLDPVFETIILLNMGYELDKMKHDIISRLDELGGNGEQIYRKNFKEYEKYITVFQKNRVTTSEDAFYFKDASLEFYVIFITPFIIDKEFHVRLEEMDEDEIMDFLYTNSDEIYDKKQEPLTKEGLEAFKKPENLVAFVNSLPLTESDKWKLFLILQNPKEYYGKFAAIIHENRKAYEKAAESVASFIKKNVNHLLKNYREEFLEKQMFIGKNMKNTIDTVIPTMALASGVLIGLRDCYYGLLTSKIYSELGQQNNSREYVQGCLKALSDSSKLEILISLKRSPKYAMELAEELNLTTATVSHHMDILLTNQLVYLEKENGRIYYHRNEEALENLIEQLKRLVL